MKKLTYIMTVLCCLAFYGCGMTEPWKDWEHEGDLSENRLRPSELKKILCASDAWKIDCQGKSFYFQFNEDGTVVSNTDKNILENAVESDYRLDFQGEEKVLLTIDNGGALQFLPDNVETIWVVTSYSETDIVAIGQATEVNLDMTHVTSAEFQQAMLEKQQAIIAYNKAQALNVLKERLCNGLLRNSSEAFVAQYAFTWNDADEWSVKFTWFQDGGIQNKTCSISLDMTGDEQIVMNIVDSPLSIQTINYSYSDGTLSTSNPAVSIDKFFHSSSLALRNGVDWLNTYTSSWSTHKLDRSNIHADFAGYIGDVEFDDRSPRNIVICPNQDAGSDWWYVFFQVGPSADNNTGRVYLKNEGESLPFGGSYGSAKTVYAAFLDFCFSKDGFYIFDDADGYTYIISPTTEQWFRMR